MLASLLTRATGVLVTAAVVGVTAAPALAVGVVPSDAAGLTAPAAPVVPGTRFSLAPAARPSSSPTHATTAPGGSSAGGAAFAAQAAGGSTTRSGSRGVPVRFGTVVRTPKATWIPNAMVGAMTTDGTYTYVAGPFTMLTDPVSGQKQNHAGLARINLATGAADGSWNPSVVGTVESLAYAASTGTLYLGGSFTAVNGQTRTNVAALSTAPGAALGGLVAVPNKDVRAVLVDGGSLVIGGVFDSVGGVTRKGLARLDASSGALDASFVPDVGGSNRAVNAIVRPPGSNVYAIGGNFTSLSSQPRPSLGEVTVSTGASTSWAPSTVCPLNLSCPIIGLDVNETSLFAAVTGPGGRTAAYDLSTGQQRWNVIADGNVQAIALFGTELYVGGHFKVSFGNQPRPGLAAVDTRTGAVDPNFRPSAKWVYPGIEAMVSTPWGVATGGALQAIGGTAQSYFALFPTRAVAPVARQKPPGTSGGTAVRRALSTMR